MLSLFALVALTAAGCAEAPRSDAMTASVAAPAAPENHTLGIERVTGGEPTEALSKPSLGNDEFQEALVASLVKSGLFQRIVPSESAEWKLRTTIISQEMRGAFRNTAELMVRYDIVDDSGHSLWGDTVYTNKEMGPGDAFSGQRRMRVLIESAARDNIADALQRLQRWIDRGPG